MIPGRRGVVLYLVLAVLAVAGSILFLLHASLTTWDEKLHVDTDDAVARHVAHGALEALMYAAELDLDVREGRATIDPVKGTLGEVVLGDHTMLERVMAPGAQPDQAEGLLRQLLGPKPFRAIAELVAPRTDVKLSYRVVVRVAKAPSSGLTDPVLKSLELDLTCAAQVHHARRARTATLAITVGTRLPGVLGKFTLAWSRGNGLDTNLLTVDAKGRPANGAQPLVSFNDPGDYSPSDPLWKAGGQPREGTLSPPPFGKIQDLAQTLASRGAVYLGSSDPQSPVILQVAAGGAPAGQHYQVLAGASGKTFALERQPLPDQPSKLAALKPPAPPPLGLLGRGATRANAKQKLWLEGMVTGFASGADSRGELGTDAAGGAASDASSIVRPLGTAAHPSLGLVYGRARARLLALSNLAVDRDDSALDERDQQKAVGVALPLAEVREPPLKHVTAAGYAADLKRESGGQPLQELFFFGSPELGDGMAHNANLTATLGDGRTVSVPTEMDYALIPLRKPFYKYGNMFASFAEYERAMCRRVEMAYNGLLRFAALDGASAQKRLMQLAFATPSPPDDRDMLAGARWQHTDPLHRALANDPLGDIYVDTATAGNPDTALADLVSAANANPRATRARVSAWGVAHFRQCFLHDGMLDLGGWWVTLSTAAAESQVQPMDLGEVTVAPLGGGVLDVPELTLAAVKNAGSGTVLEPLVVRAGTLHLVGPGPYEGTFLVTSRLHVPVTSAGHTVIRGNLALAESATADLKQPLAVVRDAALDPTGAEAHEHYRASVTTAWGGRKVSVEPDLIQANAYRREDR